MEILFAIGVALFLFVTAVIIPWVNNGKISMLQRKIDFLENIIKKLQEGGEVEPYNKNQADLFYQFQAKKEADKPKQVSKPQPPIPPQTYPSPPKPKAPAPVAAKPKRGLEEQFGVNLFVWIGGIAFILGGFFLVKYSIDIGLLTPKVRLILGGIFGAGLLYSANYIRSKPSIANGIRIAQSLAGSGLVLLYIVFYAGTTLYQFLPSFVGFIGMTAVTVTGVFLAMRHGYPIAIMALIGGFLTPALISTGNNSALMLFGYLYFIFSGFLFVIRKKHWWFLAVPTLIAAFLWVLIWLGTYFTPSDAIWLGLFLIGVSVTIVITFQNTQTITPSTQAFLKYGGLGGAVILMGIINASGNFGFMDWGLFGLLAVGGIILSYFDNKNYGFVPMLSMAVNAVMLLVWHTESYNTYLLTILIFAAIYIGSGYFIMREFRLPVKWARLVSFTAIGYYLIAYNRLHNHLFTDIPFFWGLVSLALASGAIYIIQEVMSEFQESKIKNYLLAIFASTATAFISLGLAIEIERDYLPLAFAGEIFALGLISSRFPIPSLRSITAVLLGIFGVLLLEQISLMIRLGIYSILEIKLGGYSSVPLVDNPIIQLGLPAVAFLAGSFYFLKEKDSKLVWALEMSSVALLGTMLYYLTRNIMHIDENVLFIKAGFLERGIITNILFIAGIACFIAGRRLERFSFFLSGMALFGISLFRVLYFDILVHNPLFNAQNVGGLPIVNYLFITYGITILWTLTGARELTYFDKENWAKYVKASALLLLFSFVTLNVRQIFHGEFLNSGSITNPEIYSYSVAWLLTGIGLLVLGIMRQSRMIRIASLVMMVLTVGKVFLYDASELEGLYRVFSFFGLGLCLMGLSYFYTKFVFVKREN